MYQAGVDECGWGAEAGPLVVCAFACEPQHLDSLIPLGVKDSKQFHRHPKHHHQALNTVADKLMSNPNYRWWVMSVYPTVLQADGPAQALYNAFMSLYNTANKALGSIGWVVDDSSVWRNRLPPNATAHVKGETAHAVIAAASIIAKHHQLKALAHLHTLYPQYGFDTHAGYLTAQHREAIRLFGPIPQVHRMYTLESVL